MPIGASGERFSYDNDRARHEVELRAFDLDRTPVTNAEYREWVEAGGYRRPEWWSPEGWEWRMREGVERPLYWTVDGAERRFDVTAALHPPGAGRPRLLLRGRRLCAGPRSAPAHRSSSGRRRRRGMRTPAASAASRWGDEEPSAERAGLDLATAGPAPARAHPGGEAPSGALGLVVDVWEWTASELSGYPGFRAFPYREYSEIFFGAGLRVLGGGSWVTRPTSARPTFRNWDLPERRQIFAGFRCARDA